MGMRVVLIAVIAIIMIIIAMQFMPDMTSATHEVITDSQIDTGNVTTGVGVTTGDVTLTQSLYNDATGYITSVTSDHGADNPVASAYTTATQALTISGLAASQTRDLTVVYDYDATGDYTGLRAAGRMVPTLIILALICVPAAIIWRLFSSG